MLKLKQEPSVRNSNLSKTSRSLSLAPHEGRAGCAAQRHVAPMFRFGGRSELPGAYSATYHTTGYSFEHENLYTSAGHAKAGKPPSPVMSRRRGGVSVVVGARESRAHGEGGQ